MSMSPGLSIGAEFAHLDRGDPFDIKATFQYKGHPQKLTFELHMKQGLFGTKYTCILTPFINVGGVLDWGTVGPITLGFQVPAQVNDGSQDLQLHITAEDGEHDESSWLTDVIYIGE